MVPTLSGRLQTRVFLLALVGGLVTVIVTPLLPGDPSYKVTFLILLGVAVLGVVWELIYHGLQQFRWEKDWPTLFGLLTAINEGALLWLLLRLGTIPGVDTAPSWSSFLILFACVWIAVWLCANGPMRVPFLRWRFRGGRVW
jgi:hypothetical protein